MQTEIKIREVGNGWTIVIDGTECVADAANPQKIADIILEKVQRKKAQEQKVQEEEIQEERIQEGTLEHRLDNSR